MIANREIGGKKMADWSFIGSEIPHHETAVVRVRGDVLRDGAYESCHRVLAAAESSEMVDNVNALMWRIESWWEIVRLVVVKGFKGLIRVGIGKVTEPGRVEALAGRHLSGYVVAGSGSRACDRRSGSPLKRSPRF